uniref:Family with sequence similarity 185 member A n=1 Tax=Tetraodon nigroviridis TaxID=99883 RepID=H3D3J6_TETNG
MFWSSVGGPRCVCLLRCLSSRRLAKPERPLQTSRLLSVPASPNHPVRRWALEVGPFSSVRAQLACSISVHPLDPHTFPGADRAVVTVHGAQEPGPEDLSVRYDDQSKELLICAQQGGSGLSIDLAAPINSNLFITARGEARVHVSKMECDTCRVHTEEGDCVLQSVKGHQIEVRSAGGHFTGVGTIHGNVDVSLRGDGSVDARKLQGARMSVSTERGAIKVKAIYAESSRVSSSSGRIHLGHVHGEASVENVSGASVVDGSNGFLKICSAGGDVDVYVGDGGAADIQTQEGDVCVRVPASLAAGVELRGAAVRLDPGVVLQRTEGKPAQNPTTVLGYLNGESAADRWVNVRSHRGSVRLRTQSWLESLKLGRPQ